MLLDGKWVLPAWETTWEKNQLLHKDTEGQLDAFRTAHPELYGVTTPPVSPVTHYAEYDPVDAIYYAWEPMYLDAFFYDLTHEILTNTTIQAVILHHGATDRTYIENYLTTRSEDLTNVEFIDLAAAGDYYEWETEWPFDRSLESIWTVDYGPFFIEDGDGVLSIVDPRYYPWRVNDDAIPTKLATLMGVNAFRPDLDWEGGNLFSDGEGTCFATGLHIVENMPRTQEEVESQLLDYFGCEKTIWLMPMNGDGTGHIDMFFKNASATTLIVGEYDEAMDAFNAAILDDNAALLEAETNAAGDPFEVLRVPMPSNADGVFRSYTNGIIVNDLVIVPTYAAHSTHEAEALAVFETAFAGKTVVGIDSEAIIPMAGAIHCVTRTRPVGTHELMETAPTEECSGDYDCMPGCGDVDDFGFCGWGLPYWCEAGAIYVEMCYPNERCGYDLVNDYFYCVTAGCSLPDEGECRTAYGVTVALWCSDDGFAEGERCETGTECAILASTGRAGCRTPCTDECTADETGCDDTTGDPWSCGDADDGDECLDVVTSACDTDEACVDGECVTTCTDECVVGEGGCNTLESTWTCGEASDGDDCLERVIVSCLEGEECIEGVCTIPASEPAKGCGCTFVY